MCTNELEPAYPKSRNFTAGTTSYRWPGELAAGATSYRWPGELAAGTTSYQWPGKLAAGATSYRWPGKLAELATGTMPYRSPGELAAGTTSYRWPGELAAGTTSYRWPGELAAGTTSYWWPGAGSVVCESPREFRRTGTRKLTARAAWSSIVITQSLASSPGFPLLGTKNELRRREAWSNSSHVRHFRYSV